MCIESAEEQFNIKIISGPGSGGKRHIDHPPPILELPVIIQLHSNFAKKAPILQMRKLSPSPGPDAAVDPWLALSSPLRSGL